MIAFVVVFVFVCSRYVFIFHSFIHNPQVIHTTQIHSHVKGKAIGFSFFVRQVVEPDDVKGVKLSVPHTSHCLGNGNIMISCMGDGTDQPKGEDWARICYKVVKQN